MLYEAEYVGNKEGKKKERKKAKEEKIRQLQSRAKRANQKFDFMRPRRKLEKKRNELLYFCIISVIMLLASGRSR